MVDETADELTDVRAGSWLKLALLFHSARTLHDHEAVIPRCLDGILGLSRNELHGSYKYDIHRAQIHAKHLDRHDDTIFHYEL